jgi:hypothetical protein
MVGSGNVDDRRIENGHELRDRDEPQHGACIDALDQYDTLEQPSKQPGCGSWRLSLWTRSSGTALHGKRHFAE